MNIRKWISSAAISVFLVTSLIAGISFWINQNKFIYKDKPDNNYRSIFVDVPDIQDPVVIADCGYGAKGIIVDSFGKPISNAVVSMNTPFDSKSDITNDKGIFHTDLISACGSSTSFYLSIRKNNYVPQTLIYDKPQSFLKIEMEKMTSNKRL